jgi:hypothetical protein
MTGTNLIKLVATGVLLLSAVTLPARADTINTFGFSTPLQGVSSTTVSGTFTYNSTTHTLSAASLSFNGSSIFNTVSVTNLSSGTGNLFLYVVSVYNANTHTYDLLNLNIALSTNGTPILVSGGICDFSKSGGCGTFSSQSFTVVPEGGTGFGYLAPAGMVLIGGMVMAGRPRGMSRMLQVG